MKRFQHLSIAALLTLAVAAGSLAFGHDGDHKESTEGKPATITGELIDTACFVTSDGDAKGKDHAQCAQKCMASGVPAGVMPADAKDADAVIYLLTNPAVLAPYAAQTVKVEGTLYEHKHAIDVKKLSVKDGTGWKEVPLKDEHHGAGAGGDKEHGGMNMGGMPMK